LRWVTENYIVLHRVGGWSKIQFLRYLVCEWPLAYFADIIHKPNDIHLHMYRVGRKSKLLILSEYVNKTEKIG